MLSDVSDGAAAGMGTANTTDYTFVLQKTTKPYRYFFLCFPKLEKISRVKFVLNDKKCVNL